LDTPAGQALVGALSGSGIAGAMKQ
jgi:hypothetical protein